MFLHATRPTPRPVSKTHSLTHQRILPTPAATSSAPAAVSPSSALLAIALLVISDARSSTWALCRGETTSREHIL